MPSLLIDEESLSELADEDSVPEFAHEEFVSELAPYDDHERNGPFADVAVVNGVQPRYQLQDIPGTEAVIAFDFDFMETLVLAECDFEFGDSNSFDNLLTPRQDGQVSNVTHGSLTADRVVENRSLQNEVESDVEVIIHRPSKRARTDSFDSVLFRTE